MAGTRTCAGFTLVELAIVIAIAGIMLVPLAATMQKTRVSSIAAGNRAALEAARDALFAYAYQHKGCLPHAADFEGGVTDTDANGAGGPYTDTGSVRQAVEPAAGNAGQRAGDIPWADLQLGNMGRDAKGYRIQYYVGSAYTSPTQTRASNDNAATRDDCPARQRASYEVWDLTARYSQGDVVVQNGLYYSASAAAAAGITPPSLPWALFGTNGILSAWNSVTNYAVGDYVFENGNAYRALAASTNADPQASPAQWRGIGVPGQNTPYPAWQLGAYQRGEVVAFNGRTYRALTPVVAAPPAIGWQELSIPAAVALKMLETRSGPAIASAPGNTTASLFNIFVLIAPGSDNNAVLGHIAMRDANHQNCTPTCSSWLSLNDANVDSRTFSLTPDTVASPTSADTILAVSFADYQTAMAKHSMNAQAIAW